MLQYNILWLINVYLLLHIRLLSIIIPCAFQVNYRKNYRNMVGQLLSISALYIIVDLASTILYTAYTTALP